MIKFLTAGAGATTGSTGSISFLWSSWDVFHKLARTNFDVKEIGEMAWMATGFGAIAEFRVYDSLSCKEFGEFWVLSAVKFLRVLSTADTHFIYVQLPSGRNAFFGVGTGTTELPASLQLPIRALVDSQTVRMARLGKTISELITRHPSIVKEQIDMRSYLKFESHSNVVPLAASIGPITATGSTSIAEIIPDQSRYSVIAAVDEDSLFMLNFAAKAISVEKYLLAYGALQWILDVGCCITSHPGGNRLKPRKGLLQNTNRILDDSEIRRLTLLRFENIVKQLKNGGA
jgi:hypothetical protein